LQAPSFTLELEFGKPVCGIDEAGRGPLAGPVIAACVHIPEDRREDSFIQIINDSKSLSLKKREMLFIEIKRNCLYGIGRATSQEIDTLNIHHATLLAMKRAYLSLQNDFSFLPKTALIDGKFGPELNCTTETVIKGDKKCVSIAAASILAKVTRDRIMKALHEDYPVYGWQNNAGYGTSEHLNAIQEHGVTKYHRQSFRPVREAL
jgi:ribonuclease HII